MREPGKRRRATKRSAFLRAPRSAPDRIVVGLQNLSLQDIHEIRLLLRGESVIDWHRLGLVTEDDVRRLLAVNSIDVDNPADFERLQSLRAQAVRYIRETLGLRLDEPLATELSPIQLPLLASSSDRLHRQACTLLKVMHIIYHIDARELRLALPIPDSDLFSMVEQSVAGMFDELRAAGVPVVEFSWSRKTRDSLITKLLVKRETYAARVFDRMRFRLVVEHESDLLPTLHLMLHRFIPFNYVVPGQTVNTLVDRGVLERLISREQDLSATPDEPLGPANEFSASAYRVLNFVADLPVRIDSLLSDGDDDGKGKVVFVLAEFQIMDRSRAIENERGESSHAAYKRRQHQRVRERLLREPRKSKS